MKIKQWTSFSLTWSLFTRQMHSSYFPSMYHVSEPFRDNCQMPSSNTNPQFLDIFCSMVISPGLVDEPTKCQTEDDKSEHIDQ
jgi:hypothetical protein